MTADSDTSSLLTLTDSLRSSLYRTQGDRRRQASNENYQWPCDNVAASFELLTAAALEKTYANRVFWEPTPSAVERVLARSTEPRILDLGSGMTATWCVSMAEMFAEAEVIGIDLIPTELSYLPPNLSIEIHDLLEGIPFPDGYFDLVHCRYGGAGLAGFVDDPNLKFIPEVARVLKTGGIILLEDVDDLLDPFSSESPDDNDPALIAARAQHDIRLQQIVAHRPPDRKNMVCGETLTEWVRASDAFGEEATHAKTFFMPLGAKPDEGDPARQLGSIVRDGWLAAQELQSVQLRHTDEELRELMVKDREAIPEDDVGLSMKFTVVFATKIAAVAEVAASTLI